MPPPGRLARRRAAPARPRRARQACWAGLGWGLTPRTAAPSRQSYILKPLWRAGRRIQGTRARRRPRGWRDDAGLVRALVGWVPPLRSPANFTPPCPPPPYTTTSAGGHATSAGRRIQGTRARRRPRGWRDDAGRVRAGRVQITLPPETRRPLQERAQALRPPGDTTTAALRVESSRHIDRVGARSRSRYRVAR